MTDSKHTNDNNSLFTRIQVKSPCADERYSAGNSLARLMTRIHADAVNKARPERNYTKAYRIWLAAASLMIVFLTSGWLATALRPAPEMLIRNNAWEKVENLTLADGTRYPYGGLYDYTRKDVSSSTGTLVLVVMFPNPDRSLKPGQFARVSANVGPGQPRVIVPQQSVSQAQGVNSVWVVRPDSTAAYRRVVLGDTYGTMWCVDEGLAEGEQVVTAGQQKLRDGMKVIPVKR